MRFNSLLLLFGLLALTWSSCKKDDDNNNNAEVNQMLVIENGARSVSPDASLTYTAVLIDIEGNRTAPSSITWSSSQASVATISASGQVSIASTGLTTIRASVSINGVTLTAEAPLQVQAPGLFVVAPSAVLVDADFPDIQLEPIYFGTLSPNYTYQSSNNAIASVSASGMLTFNSVGSCEITVTASNLDGAPSVVVPVMVIGVPTIALPVVRVQVSPASYAMLRNETQTFSARAFNAEGTEVSNPSITWSVEDASVATINASGVLTPVASGETRVFAMVNGIVGEAEIQVVADQVILVEPYYVSIAAGAQRQFTARQYPVVRNSSNDLVLGQPTTPSNLTWEIPSYGISIFDIASVNQSGLVTVDSNAMQGMMTFVTAYIAGNNNVDPGVASISVAIADPCNCGTADASAASLSVSPSSITLSMGQTAQINAQVLDAQGNAISGASISYCSGDIQVADVDSNGEVTGTAFLGGNTTIRVCHGNLSQTINVTVQ